MQVMDFIIGLRLELAMITNRASPIDLNEAEEIAKNIKSVSFINKNFLIITVILAVTKIKKLKIQILKLKAELKKSKYIVNLHYNHIS